MEEIVAAPAPTPSLRSQPKGPDWNWVLLTGAGALPHNFKINGKSTKLLSGGQSQNLTVTFAKPGKYPYLCTVTGHAAAGMKGTLTVT